MKKNTFLIIFISVFLTLYSNASSQTEWQIQNSETTKDLWTIDFINENTGFIAGSDGLILKTTNAGISWISQNAGFNNLIGVDFIDEQTGWVSGHHGTIYKTTNGGANWFIKNCPTERNLFFVQFVNSNTGYISSDAGVLKSTDAGENWNFSFLSPIPVYRVYFLNETHGWFGDNIANQYLSSNGGTHWLYTQNVPGAGNIAYEFINQWTGWAVGYNNSIIKTTNGGYNWFKQNNGLSITTQLRDIEFINNSSDTGWIVGRSNTVLKTTNSGNNWFSMSTPVNEEFTSVKFVNSKTGWISGFSGVILKTINGDLTGVNSVNGNVPDGFNLSQNYPNPFNPSTIIRFTLPESGTVTLNIYDVNGKEVTQLMNKYYAKGNYEIRFDGTQLSSGVYFYKLTSGNFVDTKMMTLVK